MTTIKCIESLLAALADQLDRHDHQHLSYHVSALTTISGYSLVLHIDYSECLGFINPIYTCM